MRARRTSAVEHVKKQQGVALVVALVLLVIITMLGLSSMRNTGLQERMSANMVDRSLAFQAAEAALRQGEALAATAPVFPTCTPATMTTCLNLCNNGLCSQPHPNDKPRWDPTSGFNGWQNATKDFSATLVTTEPQYFVEDMGMAEDEMHPGCSDPNLNGGVTDPFCLTPRYRITARSNAADRAATLLQSGYRP